ncbi:hypothetical protein BAUCODRAFT_401900 [Baudoinia panamericana UAMH 10762]|uniref:Uncharacterized protein n=1 Tax=Baudoinia panamericana (strain UAMH 10762) TaxID=717646 RepID=M2LXG5_BAUPA|nr:uncharacterized protein BAUCODRAFT_401900 [Baudoinia panamericana UAMH 10762]EMC99392.1 hypothetical protein BAUCODRAFT_401900 [Baudoinia panamericana UAMH 10762]
MTSNEATGLAILADVLSEYRDRISIDGSSKILCTSATVAKHVAEQVKDISTPYGPKFTVVSKDSQTSELGPNITSEPMDGLMAKMDYFSHAITDVSAEDGRSCMEIMKWAKYALQPKGIAVVIALKKQGDAGAEETDLRDRIVKQSKGRVQSLSDVLESAGFETGKIRSTERSVEVEGKRVEAELVLAMKWDQLTA